MLGLVVNVKSDTAYYDHVPAKMGRTGHYGRMFSIQDDFILYDDNY